MKFFRWRQRRDAELDAEIQSHLDEAIRDRMECGETSDEARAGANPHSFILPIKKQIQAIDPDQPIAWSHCVTSKNKTDCLREQL